MTETDARQLAERLRAQAAHDMKRAHEYAPYTAVLLQRAADLNAAATAVLMLHQPRPIGPDARARLERMAMERREAAARGDLDGLADAGALEAGAVAPGLLGHREAREGAQQAAGWTCRRCGYPYRRGEQAMPCAASHPLDRFTMCSP